MGLRRRSSGGRCQIYSPAYSPGCPGTPHACPQFRRHPCTSSQFSRRDRGSCVRPHSVAIEHRSPSSCRAARGLDQLRVHHHHLSSAIPAFPSASGLLAQAPTWTQLTTSTPAQTSADNVFTPVEIQSNSLRPHWKKLTPWTVRLSTLRTRQVRYTAMPSWLRHRNGGGPSERHLGGYRCQTQHP